jgi:hypothetical protein
MFASPTTAFKAMAEAHHALRTALTDPNRQQESLTEAIEDFAEKAKAAQDAIEKARAASEKDTSK